jgi:hypothetical protein
MLLKLKLKSVSISCELIVAMALLIFDYSTILKNQLPMPNKPITFDHNGQVMTALLMYNLSEISNTVILVLKDSIKDVNQTILFVYENYDWTTTSEIAKLYPVTTEQIINCLKSTFICAKRADHILAVYDLLS